MTERGRDEAAEKYCRQLLGERTDDIALTWAAAFNDFCNGWDARLKPGEVILSRERLREAIENAVALQETTRQFQTLDWYLEQVLFGKEPTP